MQPSVLNRRQFSVGIGAAALAGFGVARAQSEGRIVLGQSAAFSGLAAQLGIQFNQGAKLFFDQLNAAGGVGKRMVEIRTLDDGYEPDRCAENTRKLIADDVFALFGYVGTPTSLAAVPLFNQAKVPFFAPFTGAESLRQPFNRLIFHVRASYYDETALIVRQLVNLGVKKIAVFHQNDAYGKAGLDGVNKALAEHKLPLAGAAAVERNSVDVAAAVEKLVAAKPDAVVQIAAYGASAAFVRAARKAGFGGTFYNVSFVGTQALADELKTDAKGVVISQVMPFPYSPVTAIAGEYLNAVKGSKTPHTPNYSGMEGFVAAKVFAEGLRRAGKTPSRESFIQAIESMQAFDLGGFTVDFSSKKHVGSSMVELTLLGPDGKVRR